MVLEAGENEHARRSSDPDAGEVEASRRAGWPSAGVAAGTAGGFGGVQLLMFDLPRALLSMVGTGPWA